MAKAQLVNLGLAIEERRVSLDLSRTRLAQRFPVDPKTIERWEKGKNSGGFDNLAEVAEHLETTPEALQARAIEIARENDGGPTQTEPAEVPTDLAAVELAAVERHAEVMAAIHELRVLVEDSGKPTRQAGKKRASG